MARFRKGPGFSRKMARCEKSDFSSGKKACIFKPLTSGFTPHPDEEGTAACGGRETVNQ
jgi:hypothetical protein